MTDVDERWGQLLVPTDAHQGFELDPGTGIWLSLDSEGRRCVLLRNDTTRPNGDVFFETKGVEASIEELQLTGHPTSSFIVVACRDYRFWEPFLAFAESIREERSQTSEDNVGLTLRVLRKWQWLWKVNPSDLNADSALGLIGELWFLIRWADISRSLEAWCGPTGNVHDFVGQGVSVEVKTSRSSAIRGPVHRINSLQQLAPLENGALYLFSLVITPDNAAGNTLGKLVSIGLDKLERDPARQDLFLSKLSQIGWAAAVSKEFDFPFRIVSEQLYHVNASFPALSLASFPNGLPSAVTAVGYTLDMSECTEWRVAASAEEGRSLLEGLTSVD
ncbi:PD-(D/E)XK motif protein [Pseudarthrobacter sp. HLT3-5]|uniref:PD-(D/E)XK motif protein n=1 Tax=Pseudarthrobacter cellobiosi TaxID=2953654 RepID=UPI00208E4A1A|nr:PD-(D/E)XK motif protein [Pseudarthrobacter sp. HLT3-5]MCO4273836.1 PD-(D/E)XK motif protein [Pseudarthrobacter sp. HLT3-5]